MGAPEIRRSSRARNRGSRGECPGYAGGFHLISGLAQLRDGSVEPSALAVQPDGGLLIAEVPALIRGPAERRVVWDVERESVG